MDNGDVADLESVSDNFEDIDAFTGDIATFEESPSTAAHSAGEFLLYEGRVYKVTSAIAVGDSLTLGTNVSAANIGSEIKSLRDSVDGISVNTIGSTINSYIDGARDYLVLGVTRENSTERMYFSIQNNKLIVDYRTKGGTWGSLTLG